MVIAMKGKVKIGIKKKEMKNGYCDEKESKAWN